MAARGRQIAWAGGSILTCALTWLELNPPHILTRIYGTPTHPSPPTAWTGDISAIAHSMGIHRPERIKVFVSSGLSALSMGHPSYPGGALLGLPRTFLFKNVADVANERMATKSGDIEWDSPTGKLIATAMVTSLEYRRFTIAHELAHIQRCDGLRDCLEIPIAGIIASGAHWAIARKYHSSPLFLRPLRSAALLSLGWLTVYILLHRLTVRLSEHAADERAAKLGPSFARGGIEGFEQRLVLNRAMWSIYHNPDGEGEPVPPPAGVGDDFGQSKFSGHPPLRKRIERLLFIAKELNGD